MTVKSVQSTATEGALDPVMDPIPTQDSYIATGLGVAGVFVFSLSACCLPFALVSLVLGVGGAFMGWRVNQAVSDKKIHSVNQGYALVGLVTGALATLWSLMTLVAMLLIMVSYLVLFIIGLMGAALSA